MAVDSADPRQYRGDHLGAPPSATRLGCGVQARRFMTERTLADSFRRLIAGTGPISLTHYMAEANARAELMGWSRFVAMQIPYSLLDRAVERAILPMASHWDMAVLPWGLLEAGILTGKYLKGTSDPTRIDPEKLDLSEKARGVVREVQKVSEETGRPMAQVAINWVRQQQDKAQIIPILGARRLDQLQDNLAVLEWQLSDEQLKRLDEASAIDLGFPHNFLEGNRYIFGATFDKIDNHRAGRK
ncbi:MAG: aldo/keto reductase [Anaerolineales bacterium]